MHRITMQKTINEHLKDKYISIKVGANQHNLTEFTILKYKRVKDFGCSGKTTTTATTKVPLVAKPLQAVNKQVTGTAQNSNNNTNLQATKNRRIEELNNKEDNKKQNIRQIVFIVVHAYFWL